MYVFCVCVPYVLGHQIEWRHPYLSDFKLPWTTSEIWSGILAEKEESSKEPVYPKLVRNNDFTHSLMTFLKNFWYAPILLPSELNMKRHWKKLKWYFLLLVIWLELHVLTVPHPNSTCSFVLIIKLDGVGSGKHRPFNDNLQHFDTLHMTPDMWHLTFDTWHPTPDTWHVTCDMALNDLIIYLITKLFIKQFQLQRVCYSNGHPPHLFRIQPWPQFCYPSS